MKRFIAILLVLLSLLAVGCKGKEADAVDIIDFDNKPETSTPPVEAEIGEKGYGSGMVDGGLTHSIGVRTDGTVIATGQNTDGQCDVGAWTNIIYAAAGDKVSVGVKEDGSVVLAGATAGLEAASSWTGIKRVAVGAAHVAGLKADGTVVTTGAGDTGAWTDIVDIAAAGGHTVGLKADGTVVAAGDANAPDWSGIVAIDTNSSSIVGVKADGTAVTTGSQTLSAWNSLVDIAAGETLTVGVKKDGMVVTDAADDVSAITTGVSAGAGANHALFMLHDGTVKGVGSNESYQLRTSAWELRPYSDNGYLVGFAPGMKGQRVADILNDIYNATTAEVKKPAEAGSAERAVLGADEVIFTGAEAFINGESIGMIVIRGDVSGDGIIDANDSGAISNHILGNNQLDAMQIVASSIYTNASGEVMKSSVDAVNNYIADNTRSIPQFRSAIGGDTYDEKINTAKQTNGDVSGWITIPGTMINFPIMKATKDYHYNYYTWDNNKDATGAVYMYYNEARQGQFYAFTAHNNRKRAAEQPGDPTAMFHDLHHVYDKNLGRTTCMYEKCGATLATDLPDLKTYQGRVWDLNILGEEGLWEVFAVYATTQKTEKTNIDTLYENIWFDTQEKDWGWSDKLDTLYTEKVRSQDQIRAWIDKQIEKSEIDLGVKVGTSDKLLTIVTCGTDSSKAGERLYYFLHKVG